MKKSMALLLIVSIAVGFAGGRHFSKPKPTIRPSVPLRGRTFETVPEQVSETIIPFLWSRLESTNYQEYVNNLRLVHCPERTITDIVRADLRRLYAPKFAGITKARNGFDEMRERALQKSESNIKIESILYDQLKFQHPVRSAGLLFTAEQEEKISEAASLFPSVMFDPTDPESAVKSRSNHMAKIQFLSQYLSPEQLLYYKLDREGGALRVNRLLSGMQPTKQEFLAVAAAIEDVDWRSMIPGQLKPEAIEPLRKVLSPDRMNLLLDMQKPEYQGIRMFVETHQLEPYVANLLVSLRRNVFSQDPESYTQQVKAILIKPRDRAMYLQNPTIHPKTR